MDECDSVPDGATVRVETVNGGPEVLPNEPPSTGQQPPLPPPEQGDGGAVPGGGAAAGWDIPTELADIHAKVTDRVSPGHVLTGPIFVDDAAPGMGERLPFSHSRAPASYLQHLKARRGLLIH